MAHSVLSKRDFLKSVFSFFLIFSIPLIVVIIGIYCISYYLFDKELRNQDLKSIHYTLYELENELEKCMQISRQLIYKDGFEPFDPLRAPTESTRLMETLAIYSTLNPIISEIYVHFKDDDYVYDTTSRTPVSMALSNLSTYNDAPTLKLYARGLTHPMFLSRLSADEMSTFIFALPLGSEEDTRGTIVFMLDTSLLLEQLHLDHTQSIYFLDTRHLEDQLMSINPTLIGDFSPNYLLAQLQKLSYEHPITYFTLDNTVVYGFTPSYIDALTVVGFADYSKIYKPINLLNALMFLAFVLTALAIYVCTYLLFKSNSTPYMAAQNALATLNDLSSKLQHQLKDTLPVQRQFLLTQLISGQITNWDDFHHQAQSLHLILDAPYYTILMTYSTTTCFELDCSSVESIETLQQTSLQLHYQLQHAHPEVNVFLLGTSTPLIHSKLELPYVKMYFGTSHTSLQHLPKSYMLTHTLIDMSLVQSKHLDTTQTLLHSYKDDLKNIENALYEENFSSLSSLILILIKNIETTHLPFVLSKFLYLEVIILFNRYFDYHPYLCYDKINLLSVYKIDDYTALKEVFTEITHEMLAIMSVHLPSPETQLKIAQIEHYIKTHLSTPSLTLDTLATHFQVSTTYLSCLFFSHHHMSPEAYITACRIEKAKHLLVETPYSVKVIYSLVGYPHISTFISHFKEVTNLTPGQYRQKQENKKSAF